MQDKIKKYFLKNPEAFYINEGHWKRRSVHYDDDFRFNKALEQSKKDPAPVEQVIHHVNEFLNMIGVPSVLNPKMNPEKINYSQLKKQYHLNDQRDLIWIKLTTDQFVGVVAQSNDINFQLPISADDYNKRKGSQWQFNSSGIIIHKLGKQWETSFVLVFPLRLNNVNYSRHEIETAVGNYLIDQGVPVLDFCSHNY